MPVHTVYVDSSHKEEDITILLGKKTLLKLTEDNNTKALLNKNMVKQFITTTNLCNDDITRLIDNLIELEQVFHSPIILFEKKKFEKNRLIHSTVSIGNWTVEKNHTDPTQTVKKDSTSLKSSIRLLEKKDEDLLQLYIEHMRIVDKKLQNKIGFSLVFESPLFVCPHCNIVQARIDGNICENCHNAIPRKKMETLPIVKIHDAIRTIWTSGIWLNAYVAHLLRKLGWQTWVNTYVMGPSGISRRVSIMAVKNSTVLLGECIPSPVARKNVLNFLTNISKLNVMVSILATTKTIALSESERRKYFLPNPSIIRIETMGQSDETQILNDLERRLMRIMKHRDHLSSYIG